MSVHSNHLAPKPLDVPTPLNEKGCHNHSALRTGSNTLHICYSAACPNNISLVCVTLVVTSALPLPAIRTA